MSLWLPPEKRFIQHAGGAGGGAKLAQYTIDMSCKPCCGTPQNACVICPESADVLIGGAAGDACCNNLNGFYNVLRTSGSCIADGGSEGELFVDVAGCDDPIRIFWRISCYVNAPPDWHEATIIITNPGKIDHTRRFFFSPDNGVLQINDGDWDTKFSLITPGCDLQTASISVRFNFP